MRIWEAFLQGLREQGYVADRNLAIERRYLEGKHERASTFVTDFLQMKVDIIVTPNTLVARTAKERTSTIPIVFIGISDPIREGLVASLARPGGNVTGISAQFADLQAKALQILREALPRLSRLAILWTPANPGVSSGLEGHGGHRQGVGRGAGLGGDPRSGGSRAGPGGDVHASDPTRCTFTSSCTRIAHASWSMPRCTGCQSWP